MTQGKRTGLECSTHRRDIAAHVPGDLVTRGLADIARSDAERPFGLDGGHETSAAEQYRLGVMYEFGKGVPQDHSEAVRWYRLAADQGHDRAQCCLGHMYDSGKGVPQDYSEAVRWYRLAADQGHDEAQCSLGEMYNYGHGVPEDASEAVRWYRLAANQGHDHAQWNLGQMYQNGWGVPEDLSEAERWLRLAADQGHPLAVTDLKYAPFSTPRRSPGTAER